MPTEPRTVRVVCRVCDGEGEIPGPELEQSKCYGCDGQGTIDATLIPLADGQQVVVGKEAWETAVCRYAGYPTCNTREQAGAVYGPKQADGSEFEEAWELAEAGATSVLTALFGKDDVVAADKAGVVSHFEGAINEACVVGLEDGHPGHRLVVVNVGDTIYIKRLEENKP